MQLDCSTSQLVSAGKIFQISNLRIRKIVYTHTHTHADTYTHTLEFSALYIDLASEAIRRCKAVLSFKAVNGN